VYRSRAVHEELVEQLQTIPSNQLTPFPCGGSGAMSDEIAAHSDYRARVPHSLHTAPFPPTSGLYHGHKFAATKASGYRSLLIECGNRRYEYREGCIEHDASQGSFRFSQCYPHYD